MPQPPGAGKLQIFSGGSQISGAKPPTSGIQIFSGGSQIGGPKPKDTPTVYGGGVGHMGGPAPLIDYNTMLRGGPEAEKIKMENMPKIMSILRGLGG